jgi:hypothetical protein
MKWKNGVQYNEDGMIKIKYTFQELCELMTNKSAPKDMRLFCDNYFILKHETGELLYEGTNKSIMLIPHYLRYIFTHLEAEELNEKILKHKPTQDLEYMKNQKSDLFHIKNTKSIYFNKCLESYPHMNSMQQRELRNTLIFRQWELYEMLTTTLSVCEGYEGFLDDFSEYIACGKGVRVDILEKVIKNAQAYRKDNNLID